MARVRLGYRLAGDTRDVERDHQVTIRRRDAGWVVADDRRLSPVADPWELILVRPGMELALFARCEPEQARYWCDLP